MVVLYTGFCCPAKWRWNMLQLYTCRRNDTRHESIHAIKVNMYYLFEKTMSACWMLGMSAHAHSCRQTHTRYRLGVQPTSLLVNPLRKLTALAVGNAKTGSRECTKTVWYIGDDLMLLLMLHYVQCRRYWGACRSGSRRDGSNLVGCCISLHSAENTKPLLHLSCSTLPEVLLCSWGGCMVC